MRRNNHFDCAAIAFLLVAPLSFAQETDHKQHQLDAATTQGAATAATSSETEHVAPEPPEHVMGDMSYADMVSAMQMDDTSPFGRVILEQLEWRNTSAGDAARWDVKAWYGGDYNRVFVKSHGELVDDAIEDASAELLWDRIFARWWSVQAGVRTDFGEGPERTWAAVGVEGLAPYWFDVEATFYVGDAGRTALRFKADYDLLFTQRLILRTELEAGFYGKDDPERQLGSGLSSGEIALRLRYEIRREIAPYIGISWHGKFAATADYARASGEDVSDAQAIAGLRIWF